MTVSHTARMGPIAAVAAAPALWAAWYALVLRHLPRSVESGSPAWLRIPISWLMYRACKSWVSFSHNLKDMLASGRLDPSRQAMLVVGPHGQYTVGALCFYSYWVAKGWPWKDMHAVVADVLLKLPVVGDYLHLVRTKSADERVVNDLLAAGRTIALYPGGIYEQVRTDENEEKLYFPNKLGFVRLAMKHGVDLVPLHTFGENQLWPTSDAFRSANKWVYSKLGVGNVLLHSPLWKVPTSMLLPSPLLMPRLGAPLHCRFGDQVRVGPADPSPSDEKVAAVFERYVEALGKLFNEHKDACLPPAVAARGLTVVLRGGKHGDGRVWKFGEAPPRSKL